MYASDFDSDTASWSPLAVGIHLRLMNYSWINNYLPNDTKALSVIVRMDHGNFRKAWPIVKGKWQKAMYPNPDGIEGETIEGLFSRRLEEEREKKRLYIEKQRELGKLGAKKKVQNYQGI